MDDYREVVIKISETSYNAIKDTNSIYIGEFYAQKLIQCVKDGILLSKGHGKIVDIGKIDEDKIDDSNPIIYLTVNGEYTEAVSLDYLNDLPVIIPADKEE